MRAVRLIIVHLTMLQNDIEMFNVELGGNARYFNGHMHVVGSMAAKMDGSSKKLKIIPKQNNVATSSPKTERPKFSDRLKALLNSSSIHAENGLDADDPYTFSEPEPQALRLYQKCNTNNAYLNKCFPSSPKVYRVSAKTSKNTPPPVTNLETRPVESMKTILSPPCSTLPVEKTSSLAKKITDNKKVIENGSIKTLNRLQAKITQNRVKRKHSKVNNSVRSETVESSKLGQLAWHSSKDKSLLEEQLLGIKSEVVTEDKSKSPPSSSSVKLSHSPAIIRHSYTTVVPIPPKRRFRKLNYVSKGRSTNNILQRLQMLHEDHQDYNLDLYSLGLEQSDSEESEDNEDSEDFQRYWFSGWGEPGVCVEGRREGKLGLVKSELRRRLKQVWRGLKHSRSANELTETVLEAAYEHPRKTASFLQQVGKKYQPVFHNRYDDVLLRKRMCTYKKGEEEACKHLALPCTQHCVRHIMYNVDQLLFEHCTAKFSDNTQCCVPVFDISHELPLCTEHARKRDNYDRMCAEIKPKRVRKRSKPSSVRRPTKRGKKKKRVQRISEHASESIDSSIDAGFSEAVTSFITGYSLQLMKEAAASETSKTAKYITVDVSAESSVEAPSLSTDVPPLSAEIPIPNGFCIKDVQLAEQVEEAVLEISDDLPLDTEDLSGPRLLENLETVIDMMPPEALNELFSGDKNGQYFQPTKEETEELERALEAVDEDVKSLEKLTQTQGLLQTFLDEHTLVQTLTQLPDVSSIMPAFTPYHNGFVVDPHSSSFFQIKNNLHHPGLILDTPQLTIQPQTDMPS